MLIPGPDHPITLKTAKKRWRAFFNGHVIADTNDALILQEANYPPVVYFPREDVAMEYMARTDRTTHCPYKGDAAYYTLVMDGKIAENAVWTYEEPFESMDPITARLAFYADQVEVYDVDDAAVNPRHDEDLAARAEIDEVVQHTDAGDGTSQGPHWTPNVEVPAEEGGLR
ncbi:DUF427 domain-containing protein [Phenylobacterium hankyongense]|uniref:DUF427 domain-containing protein n=1 Tax=Phenylobacterium hankyongense TaxID=1813876 RepID=A0A328B298_9CAUL|nr:DUF427 domain-containing protein [Phenylobacterium hankyongense]RAK60036.1 DUF427 domain-containing protein [Phenylobacterium hankyongense]